MSICIDNCSMGTLKIFVVSYNGEEVIELDASVFKKTSYFNFNPLFNEIKKYEEEGWTLLHIDMENFAATGCTRSCAFMKKEYREKDE